MEIARDMQIVIDYCIENNIKYKVCEYVAGRGLGYKIGKVISMLYIDVNLLEGMKINYKFANFHGFALCRLTDKKSIKVYHKRISFIA